MHRLEGIEPAFEEFLQQAESCRMCRASRQFYQAANHGFAHDAIEVAPDFGRQVELALSIGLPASGAIRIRITRDSDGFARQCACDRGVELLRQDFQFHGEA